MADQVLGATLNVAVPVSSNSNGIVAGPGRIFGVTVTATGSTPLQITDGNGGLAIFGLAASPALGYYAIPGGNQFQSSIFVVGSSSNPAFTVHYANQVRL